jgi:hypothetical protein
LLHPRLCYLHTLSARAAVVEAAREVLAATPPGGEGTAVAEGGLLKALLAAGGALVGDQGSAGKALEALVGLAVDNFVDLHKLDGGRNVQGKIGAFQAVVGGQRYVMPGGAEEAASFMENRQGK